MHWKDWLPGRKPKGPVELVPPRFIGDTSAKKLVFHVSFWGSKLKNDYSLPTLSQPKPWKKLRDVGIASRKVEVVSLLAPGEQGLRIRDAIARLPGFPNFGQCAPQRIAEALDWELLKLVWPAFAGHQEARLHFFGTAWKTDCKQILVPRVRISASGHDFLVTWAEDEGSSVQTVWLENDFAVIFA